jgi:hypothetical protein
VRTQQREVARTLLDDQHIVEHNSVLEQKNKELEEAKKQLLEDEEEFVVSFFAVTLSIR